MVDAHFDFAWRTLLRLGVPHAEVDAATRDVFVAVAQRLERVPLGDERPFLLRTVLCVAGVRGRAGVSPMEPERQALQEILNEMTSEVRIAFVLVELEGLPARQVAGLLQVSASTVDERLERARVTLRTLPRRRHGLGSLT